MNRLAICGSKRIETGCRVVGTDDIDYSSTCIAMNWELDHIFILVEPEASVADLLLAHGLKEGPGNRHPGQGTTNRRFYFANGMLEFLWVHDVAEAMHGPGRNLCFAERAQDPTASPFGMIFLSPDPTNRDMPFPGWTYQPDYFAPPNAFHVGANSNHLAEPLCFCAPFIKPRAARSNPADTNAQTMTQVCIHTPARDRSGILNIVNQVDRLAIELGNEHLLEITLNGNGLGCSKDFRPDLPLIIHGLS